MKCAADCAHRPASCKTAGMATKEATELDIDGRSVRVSNPSKLYFAGPVEVTKLELVQNYLSVAADVVVVDAAGRAGIVYLGCIELHPHPVRAGDLLHPDELRGDLDPGPGVAWDDVRRVALEVKELLDELGLVGWPKTSGSRGMHVSVRIQPRWTFTEVRRAALALSREIERRAPTLASSKWWKEERHGVIL